MLNRPEDVARAVMFALQQPPGCEVRELLIAPSEEPSWP
jgi:NADP-dependent 3-hydroxy acid dehydrogenase YdfG